VGVGGVDSAKHQLALRAHLGKLLLGLPSRRPHVDEAPFLAEQQPQVGALHWPYAGLLACRVIRQANIHLLPSQPTQPVPLLWLALLLQQLDAATVSRRVVEGEEPVWLKGRMFTLHQLPGQLGDMRWELAAHAVLSSRVDEVQRA
jgi:hypothetical protein